MVENEEKCLPIVKIPLRIHTKFKGKVCIHGTDMTNKIKEFIYDYVGEKIPKGR